MGLVNCNILEAPGSPCDVSCELGDLYETAPSLPIPREGRVAPSGMSAENWTVEVPHHKMEQQ